MKKYISFIFILTIINLANAQSLPEIAGNTIENKIVHIPNELKGKFSLLGFASSMKAQPDLETWLDPIYQKFIAKTGLMDDMYDLNVYFIPILTGTNITFAASMKKKFKEMAQEDLKPHLLFCTDNGKEILEKLSMNKSDTPYFLLLDKEGKILYRTSGAYSEEKFDAIDNLIE
jgi:hypothetical protein